MVLGDLEETLRILNYYPLYKALGIPAWNIYKKYRAKKIVRDTTVWMWGEILLEIHPEHAEPTYYYAQISTRAKRVWKHFKNQKWRRRRRALYKTNQEGAPDYTNIARLIISETGLTKKTRRPEGYDDAEQKIAKFLTELHKHLEDTTKEADLSNAEERFREQAGWTLKLRGID